MRGFILFIAALMVFGCAQSETPVGNETNVTNQTNITEPVCFGPVCGSDGTTYGTDCEAQAANVSFTNGSCAPAYNCTESDGGIESKKAGSVTFDETYSDYCLNESYLLEYACVDNEPANASIFCENGCDSGACNEPPPPPPDLGCAGPVEPDVYRIDFATFNGTQYNDTCIDYTTVKDYYCKDKVLKAQNSQCPAGYRCEDGGCKVVEEQCTETDLGRDIYQRGRTLHTKGLATLLNEWDVCIDEGLIKEYYCTLNGSTYEEIECGTGYRCASGKCVESDCTDSDGGYNIYKSGTTELYDKEMDDDCIGQYRLREFYCYGNSIEYDDVYCPEDYICNADRCMEGSYD
jgi:hypothetical protein